MENRYVNDAMESFNELMERDFTDESDRMKRVNDLLKAAHKGKI